MTKRLLAGILSFILLCYSVFYMNIDVFAKNNVLQQEKQIIEKSEDDISESSTTYINRILLSYIVKLNRSG